MPAGIPTADSGGNHAIDSLSVFMGIIFYPIIYLPYSRDPAVGTQYTAELLSVNPYLLPSMSFPVFPVPFF